MKFGCVPLSLARGAILAHTLKAAGLTLRKGTILEDHHLAALRGAGLEQVVAARMEADDLEENEAAHRLAMGLAGSGVRVAPPFTGRANIHARHAGVLRINAQAVAAFNLVDESLTLATLPAWRQVEADEMVATVKIIPFAASRHLVLKAEALSANLLSVMPFRRTRMMVISTLLPGLTPKVVNKTIAVTAARLDRMGARIVGEERVPHEAKALAEALRRAARTDVEGVIIFGASAIADRRDVIPAALEQAGGRVERLGLPVDPGNLLMLGSLGALPVLGAPGCARSPKENGFDWILARILADIPITSVDAAHLGVGGLLSEIVTRPQPRDLPPVQGRAGGVAAVVLAAGRATRMGGPNKLLADISGKPVVRRVVEAALAGRASPVIVVTGHEHHQVEAALAGLDVRFVHNDDYPAGLSGSVRVGIQAVPDSVAGAIILLGDMPLVSSMTLDELIAAFAPERGREIVVPVSAGRRGNPVLWSRRFFADLAQLSGDRGARHLIDAQAQAVCEVEVQGEGVVLDVDTPSALAEAQDLWRRMPLREV